ncbi:MAG: hypothetical protein HS114_34660 [Anaerolineales bacterium]|nr:hypothetical protein [Anaerolineales bacterium]
MQLSLFDDASEYPKGYAPPVEAAPLIGEVRTNGASAVAKPNLDYRITVQDPIGSGGQAAKIRQNIEIIRLLKRLKEEKRQATPEEQKQLVLYTGWGHSGQLFHPQPRSKWIDFQAELKPLLDEHEWRAASFSTINAHYTTPEVIAFKWDVLGQFGFTGGRILEPAAGAGHYIGLMPPDIKARSEIYACELDLLSAQVVKQLYPSVKLHVGGYETTTYDSDFFDLAISNVPFADLQVHDPSIYENGRAHLSDIGLHNYFFVKALEQLRPGGLLAFITSRFTLDAHDTKVRAYLDHVAYFLGAVRLPVTAFKKNAHTEVTTDIIFLMKREHPKTTDRGEWVDTVKIDDYRLNCHYNRYPDMMLGEMQLEGGRYEDAYECVAPKNFDIGGALDEILAGDLLPSGIYKPAPPRPRRQIVVESYTFDNPPADPWIRPGSYAMDDWYRIWQMRRGGAWVRANLEGRQLQRVRGLIEIRDAFHRTIQANVTFESAEHLKKVQQELNTVYRRFVAKWGFLHEPANIAAFGEDVDSDNILALERWDPFTGRAEKAAIFSERLIQPETRPEHADDPMDALIIALRETGQVALPRMTELTGMREDDLIEKLAGKIFYDPELNLWVTADEYLSGNIRQKLAMAEHAEQMEDEKRYTGVPTRSYDANILALKEVMPREVGPKDIFVQLGSPWVPPDIISDFIMRELFSDPSCRRGTIKAQYVNVLGCWRLELRDIGQLRASQENRQTWGTNRIEGVDLIEKCLNGQQATIYDTWTDDQGKEHKEVNQEATLVARAKQNDIRAAFDKWVWINDERTERLVKIYNEKFNSTLPRKFDGTPVNFPGLNPAITLRQIQKDVIWRGLQEKALMMAHAVGFGKTYSLTGLTMRLRQTRLRQRIMIVVKRATFGQFVQAFRHAYPLAKISPIASGQTPAHRRRQIARIATEDYDVIITTHPVMSKIPLKPQTRLDYLNAQMEEIEAAILAARGSDISTKELEKAKARLSKKIKDAMSKGVEPDPNTLYFEDLGLDALLVDEASAYKNLWFHSIMTRISGIGGTESGRAFDMFLKVRHLQARGGFVCFATGTPVENSISEVWVMMQFLMPDRLRELGLHHFDAWAATFGKVVTGVEMKPDGSGFRMASRFASFNNLVQLKRLWREVADTRMSAEEAGIERPPLMTGKPIGKQAEPYSELKRIVKTLANRANNLGDVDPSVDNILVIMNDADKASLDARLLGRFPEMDENGKWTGEYIHVTEDYPGSKVNMCADQVAEIYRQTTGVELPDRPGFHNLTQLIFLDSSTPVKKMGSPTVRLPILDEDGKPTGESREVYDPDNIIAFTVYEDLYQKLVARGVKPEHIAFAQEYGDDLKKEKLAAMLNAGKIRVCIGHTEIMGIGLNCQRLLVALHHLDCPWKPAWLEQREGRIWRQGNLCPAISIYRYVMGGSFDVYRWQTVERKYAFITAFNSDDMTLNSIEDPGMAVLSAREMTALATGNPAIIRQVELQTRLRILSAQKRAFDDAQYQARGRLRRLIAEREDEQDKLNRRLPIMQRVEAEGLEPALTLGQQLYDLCASHFEVFEEKVEIAELYGLKVYYEGIPEKEEKPKVIHQQKVDRNFWGAAESVPLPASGEAAAPAATEAPGEPPPPAAPPKRKVERSVYLESEEFQFRSVFDLRISEDTRAALNANVLKGIFEHELPAKIRAYEEFIRQKDYEIAETDKMLARPFEHADEMAAIEAELSGVEREIRDTLGEADAAENRQAARIALEIGQFAEEIIEASEPDDDEASDAASGASEGTPQE